MKRILVLALFLAPLASFAKAPAPVPPAVQPPAPHPLDGPEWAVVYGDTQEREDLVNSTIQAVRFARFGDCENDNGILTYRDRAYFEATYELSRASRVWRHASGAPILRFVSGLTTPTTAGWYRETLVYLTPDRRAIRAISTERFDWSRENMGPIDAPNYQWVRRSVGPRSCSI